MIDVVLGVLIVAAAIYVFGIARVILDAQPHYLDPPETRRRKLWTAFNAWRWPAWAVKHIIALWHEAHDPQDAP